MFIDIANFTAWCSEREPSQVFTLLENVYHTFDEIGESLGIFKVETIGDSYVAVAGIPTPRTDHAVVMVHFAMNCIRRLDRLLKELEVHLGRSTGDLQVRVGVHSGPVTAGVLRGAKARFQLFGKVCSTRLKPIPTSTSKIRLCRPKRRFASNFPKHLCRRIQKKWNAISAW
jgi:class 3 adenylate cyclase